MQVNYSYRVRAEVLCNIQLQRLTNFNTRLQISMSCPTKSTIYQSTFDLLQRCNMVNHRFPHDTQHCQVSLESWTFTDEDLRFFPI